jgi:hypothetical protein
MLFGYSTTPSIAEFFNRISSKPPFAAVDTKVGFGPFMSIDTKGVFF